MKGLIAITLILSSTLVADEIKFGKTKGALAKADVVFRNFLRDRLILDII